VSGEDDAKTQVFTDEEALWRLVTALAGSRTPVEVAESLAQEGWAAAGGSFANMAVIAKDAELVHVVRRPAGESGIGTRWTTFHLTDEIPACHAIRSGLPVLLGSREEILRRYPGLAQEIQEAGLAARASLPLHSADGETVGAVGFGWPTPQPFTAAQLRRLDLIAQLTGLALSRATDSRSYATDGVLETMPNAFFSMDSERIITYVNAEGERLLRDSRDNLVGKHFFRALPQVEGSEFDVQYRTATATGRPVVFEEYYAPLETWFEVHAWPDQHGLNVYFSDISERRNSEVSQIAALAEARKANARLNFLTDLSVKLAGARTQPEVFDRLSRAVVPAIADWCTIVVPVGEELVRVAAVHNDPVLDGLAKRLVGSYPHPFSGPSPGVVAYRSGQPLRLDRLAQQIVDDLDDSVASAAYGRTLQLLGDGPGLIAPISCGDEVVAVLTMIRIGGEPFGDADIAIIDEVNARVASSLDDAVQTETQRETARALQAAALPRTLPSSDQLQLGAGYRAASEGEVGGDWYDALELQSGHIALVVGDTAGHGVQAAALMTQIRNSLRAFLFESLGPAESLAKLRNLIAIQEPDAFATIVCVDLDPDSGELVWASAGHPAPILLSGDGTSFYLRGEPSAPIGWPYPDLSERQIEHRVTLKPTDRLVMFTDGLIERRGVDLEIGLTHLMITAEQTRDRADAGIACESILEVLLGASHEDDVCLLIADFKPLR
jgi:serine phosphatase RsbU (regulator of sigma subunit)/PAS domain-containing protein